ncbi:AraC family transcriptional regulator [Winogradskyella sp.]|uniref:helix-turn-helix domain-containing protein n=1 Tax=Winogradskyella sp. TaxID=1883156 RepID=UPI0026266522|nr:helix-turn-helix domain-containing protein [Winogradskyella sp.]
MSIQLSVFDLIILLGIFQGFITSTLLFITKKNSKSNRFLALGLFSFCLLSTKPLLHTLSLWETHFFGYFPNALELAVAPLFFFYVKSLFTPTFRFKNKHWLHFLPFFISQAYAFFVYFSVLQTEDNSKKKSIADDLFFNEVKQLDEYILLIATVLYLYQAFHLQKNYKKWLDDNTSDNQLPDFKWLKQLLQLFGFTALFLLIGRILSLLTTYEPIWFADYFWKFLNLYIAFLIYYLGLKGYLQPHYSFPEIETTEKETVSTVNYSNSANHQKIERAMKEDKIFLNTQLSLQALANHLGLPQREVSQIINQYFKTNFRDFINHYRIEEVKSKLNHPNYSKMSILGIAMESGFSSETSFYRLFKKYVGMTPKQFLEQKSDN